MRVLFIEELDAVNGGRGKPDNPGGGRPGGPPGQCMDPTTLACGEEANGCSGC